MSVEEMVFEAEVSEILRTAEPSGKEGGAAAASLPESVVAEMVKGDDEPFFAIMTFLKEGPGLGRPRKKNYRAPAVEAAARACPGTISYLGHVRPEDRETTYRTPQGRCVRSWSEEAVDKAGRRIKVAKAKVYVSRESRTLRTHIQEGLAGPVSWVALVATSVDENGDLNVDDVHEVLSIDFCNPGTAGVGGAGVEKVVRETKTEGTMSARLSKDQLMAEYGAEIREVAREQADAARKPLEAQVSETRAAADKASTDLKAREAEVAEAKRAVEKASKEVADLRAENAVLKRDVALAQLDKERDRIVSEISEVSDEVREMLKKRVPTALVEGDDAALTRSRAALAAKVEEAMEDLRVVAEMTGGTIAPRRRDAPRAPAATGRPARPAARPAEARKALSAAIFEKADRKQSRQPDSDND